MTIEIEIEKNHPIPLPMKMENLAISLYSRNEEWGGPPARLDGEAGQVWMACRTGVESGVSKTIPAADSVCTG